MSGQVKLSITKSTCRGGLHRRGDVFYVGDTCPPLCHELWHAIYPSVYVLLNQGDLDYGETRRREFEIPCPDGGRVVVKGEIVKQD